MDISLNLYKIFCTVVTTGSMSLAAAELFISQPAVSMSINQLEEQLGRPVLIRTKKGVLPTKEGEVLYKYLKQALDLIDTAEKKYKELASLTLGEIRIGSGDTILSHFLIPILEKFISLYPNINIKITNKTTYETLSLLKAGKVDMAFVNLPILEESNFKITKCLSIQDCMICGPKFKQLTKGVKLHELTDYPLMLLEKESNTRRYLDTFAEENHYVFKPNLELGSSDLLVKFTQINLGIAFVIREFTKEIDNESLFEIPLSPPIPSRHIGLITLKDVPLSYASENFIKLLRD